MARLYNCLIATLSLFVPKAAIWVRTEWINYLLMLVMFGMGLTLKVEDFRYILSHPKYIILGCVSQFTVMPLSPSDSGLCSQYGITYRRSG